MPAFLSNSVALTETWPRMSSRERALVGAMHEHYEAQFAEHRNDPNQLGLAAALHDMVDTAVESQRIARAFTAPRVQCRAGCSACCRQNVTVTRPEALLLLEAARDAGVAVDWQRVARQAQHPGPRWRELEPADRACVFLGDDERCSVYEHRPAMCRKLQAVSPPALCDTIKHPGAKVQYLVCIEAETMTSAAMLALESISMPVMLQRVAPKA